MTTILRAIAQSPLVCRIGWTLVHSLWLGAAAAALLAMATMMLRRRSANARYLAGCAAMAALMAATIATFFLVSSPGRAPLPAPVAAAVEMPPRPAVPAPAEAPGQAASPWAIKNPPSPSYPVVPAAPAPPIAGPAAPPETLPARAARILEPAMPSVVLAWAVGAMLMSLWQLSGWMAATRIRRLATLPSEPAVCDALARLAAAMRIGRPVKALQSAIVKVPTLIGWLRPVILLPACLASGLSTEQLEAVLLHELAHIRRLDYLVNLLQRLVETLLFYHPAVWFISRRIRVERENCCDDVVVEACGDPALYANALVAVAGRRSPRLAVAASGGSGKLLPRIRRIVGLPEESSFSARWLAGILTLACLALAGAIIYGCASGSGTDGRPAAQLATQQGDEPNLETIREALAANEAAITTFQGTLRRSDYSFQHLWRNASRKAGPAQPHEDVEKARADLTPRLLRTTDVEFAYDRSRGKDYRIRMVSSSGTAWPIIEEQRNGRNVQTLLTGKDGRKSATVQIDETRDTLTEGFSPSNLQANARLFLLATSEDGYFETPLLEAMGDPGRVQVYPGIHRVEGQDCVKLAVLWATGNSAYVSHVWLGKDIHYHIVKQETRGALDLPKGPLAFSSYPQALLASLEQELPTMLIVCGGYVDMRGDKWRGDKWVPRTVRSYSLSYSQQPYTPEDAAFAKRLTDLDAHTREFREREYPGRRQFVEFGGYHVFELDIPSLSLNKPIGPSVFEDSIIPEDVPVTRLILAVAPGTERPAADAGRKPPMWVAGQPADASRIVRPGDRIAFDVSKMPGAPHGGRLSYQVKPQGVLDIDRSRIPGGIQAAGLTIGQLADNIAAAYAQLGAVVTRVVLSQDFPVRAGAPASQSIIQPTSTPTSQPGDKARVAVRVEAAKVLLQQARGDLQGLTRRFQQGAATQAELDEAKFKEAAAEMSLELAQRDAEGDRAGADRVRIQFAQLDLERRRLRLEAATKALQAKTGTQAEVEGAQIDLRLAEIAVALAQAAGDSLQEAGLRVEAAKVMLEHRRTRLARYEDLLRRQATTPEEVERARTDVRLGELELQEVQAALEEARQRHGGTTAQPASAPAAGDASSRPSAPPGPATIHDLKPPFTFTVRAVALDGTPQAGVKVRCVHPRIGRRIVDIVAESGADGVARFQVQAADLLTDRSFWFSVADTKFVGPGLWPLSPLERTDATWTVLPAKPLRFRVTDESGQPVRGATIQLALNRPPLKPGVPPASGWTTARTDDTGRAVVAFADGPITVSAVANGYASVTLENVRLEEDSPMGLTLPRGGRIVGRVTDRGKAVPGVQITATKEALGEAFALRALSDPEGKFILAGASAGEWSLTARVADDRLLAFSPVQVAVPAHQEGTEVLIMPNPLFERLAAGPPPPQRATEVGIGAMPAFRLKGRYVAADSTALDRQEQMIVGHNRNQLYRVEFLSQPEGTFDIVFADCQGSFLFFARAGYYARLKVPPGQRLFGVSKDREDELEFWSVPSGTYEGIEVVLLRTATLRGRLVGPQGRPVAGKEVIVRPTGGYAQTDSDGRFVAEIPPLANVVLEFRRPDSPAVFLKAELVDVKEGQIITRTFTDPRPPATQPASRPAGR